jgi:hypothetical protein
MSRVKSSSPARFAGRGSGFEGLFVQGARHVDVLGVESELVPTVARFRSLPGEGVASRSRGIVESSDMAGIGIPICTGALEPVNHDANPLVRSSTRMTPSLSPVSVGMKPSSPMSTDISFLLVFEGLLLLLLLRFRSGDFDFGESIDGKSEVRLRCCVGRGRLAGFPSSQD